MTERNPSIRGHFTAQESRLQKILKEQLVGK